MFSCVVIKLSPQHNTKSEDALAAFAADRDHYCWVAQQP